VSKKENGCRVAIAGDFKEKMLLGGNMIRDGNIDDDAKKMIMKNKILSVLNDIELGETNIRHEDGHIDFVMMFKQNR